VTSEPHGTTEGSSRSNVDVQGNPDTRLGTAIKDQSEVVHNTAAAAIGSSTDALVSPDGNHMVEPTSAHQTTGEPEVQEETVSDCNAELFTGSDLDEMLDERNGQIVLAQSDEIHPAFKQYLPMRPIQTSLKRTQPTTRIHTTFEEGTMTESQAGPSRISPAPLPGWRRPHDRTHLKLSMNRIHTDYILSNDFVDDINEMLNTIRNWSRERATEVMKSFREDLYNEGRNITFYSNHILGGGLTWNVRIENPNGWMPNTSCITAQERLQQRMEESKYGYGGVVPTCPGGCGPECRPYVRTKEQNEQALARGSEMRRQEKERKESRAAAERDKASRELMLPPPLPRRVLGRTEQSPPTPRLKPLSEENIAKLVAAPLYPPRSPRLGTTELKLTVGQLNRLEANKPPQTPHPGRTSERTRDAPSSRPSSSKATLIRPSPRTTYVKVTDVAKKRSSSYCPAFPDDYIHKRYGGLPDPDTQPAPQSPPPETASDALNKYRNQLSQMLSKLPSEASNKRPSGHIVSKRPKKQHHRMELFQVNSGLH
jgi:hypothetical protein